MEYYLRQLSKLQTDEYNKIRQGCCTNQEQKAAELCLIYYLDYKNGLHHSQHIPNQKIQLALKCAYFLAQKSQYTKNLKGEHIRGISFSLNKLLKDFKLDDTMCMLKQFHKYVKIQDKDISQYLANVIKQISFLYAIHGKFDKTIQKLELKQRHNSEGNSNNNNYLSVFKSYAWLLFIQSKNKLLKKSLQLIPNTYMIAHIICWMLIYSWDYIKSEAILSIMRERRINENMPMGKQITRIIKEKMLEHFRIKDLADYSSIAKMFEDYFNKMIDNNNVRMKNDNDFLSPENLIANYRRLDSIYQKNIDPQDLDERIFVKERALNHTPTKFTPFARQGYLNKLGKPANKLSGNINGHNHNKEQTFTSHRILNYDMIEKQADNNKNVPTHEIKLPKTLMQSPSMVKVPLICSTPVTAGMEMYNYLKQKTKKIKDINMSSAKQFDRKIFGYIDRVFMLEKEYDQKVKEVKKETIVALYKISSEQYLSNSPTYEKEHNRNELMKAFLALSIELVFFVSNEKVEFEDIERQLKVNPFEMWKSVDYFLKSDKTIPTTLKLHLLDIEVNLISYKIWKSSEMVKALSCVANKNYDQSDPQIPDLEKLFKRTLHQIAFQITRLSSLLNLDEGVSEKVFETMKEILLSHEDLLEMRHIDQLIMCAFFVIGKLQNIALKFNEIQAVYMESNPNLKNVIEEIIMKIYINRQKSDADIIYFYNKVFIVKPQLKESLLALLDPHSNSQRIPKNNVIMMSPLHAIIPKQIRNQKNTYTNKNKGNITPQTQLLYAYNQSPILKYDVSSFRGPLKTKKVLNYQEEQQKVKSQVQQEQPQHTRSIYSHKGTINVSTPQNQQAQSTNTMTNQFISKKFGRNKVLNTQKQNINNTAVTPTNSHRSLFDNNTTDKKDTIIGNTQNNKHMNNVNINVQEQTWYRGKKSQIIYK